MSSGFSVQSAEGLDLIAPGSENCELSEHCEFEISLTKSKEQFLTPSSGDIEPCQQNKFKDLHQVSTQVQAVNKQLCEAEFRQQSVSQDFQLPSLAVSHHQKSIAEVTQSYSKDRFLQQQDLTLQLSQSSQPISIEESDSQGLSSQVSNWSSTSENSVHKQNEKCKTKELEINSIKELIEHFGYKFPDSLVHGIDPLGNTSMLNTQICDLADVIKTLLDIIILDAEADTKTLFTSTVMQALSNYDTNPTRINYIELAVNTLESIKEFYRLTLKDLSRNGSATRKLVLESVAGSTIRDRNQLSQLADAIGARRKTLYIASKERKKVEENEKIIPLIEKLGRKPPEGEHIICEEWKLNAVNFYEQKSELIKGHNNLYKEKVKGDHGQIDLIVFRRKRVLQLSLIRMLPLAKSEIGWPFGLRSLLSLRPPWVLLPKSRYILGCLCEICQNVSLILRAIHNLILWLRHYGSPEERAEALAIDSVSSLSEFIEMVLHPKVFNCKPIIFYLFGMGYRKISMCLESYTYIFILLYLMVRLSKL